eukprot:364175-Chlamydomonas_euryale.AAC.8
MRARRLAAAAFVAKRRRQRPGRPADAADAAAIVPRSRQADLVEAAAIQPGLKPFWLAFQPDFYQLAFQPASQLGQG